MVSLQNLRHRLICLSSLLLLTVGLALGASGRLSADSYNVQATVPYPTPTQAATFTPGLDGTTVETAALTVSGTCQVANPSVVITIIRGGTVIGSAVCNGTFSLQIVLVEGPNTLIARTANVNNLYGPDSPPITVTLALPPNPTPPTGSNPVSGPTTPAQTTQAINAGSAANLQATTVQPFSVLANDKSVSVAVTVAGGNTPYTILLNWGDGTTQSQSEDAPGTYTFSHTYHTAQAYTVHGTVQDVLGDMTEFNYAVVSFKKTPATSATVPPATALATATNAGISFQTAATTVALLGAGAVIGGVGFWFGSLHAVRGASAATGQATNLHNARSKHRAKK